MTFFLYEQMAEQHKNRQSDDGTQYKDDSQFPEFHRDIRAQDQNADLFHIDDLRQ